MRGRQEEPDNEEMQSGAFGSPIPAVNCCYVIDNADTSLGPGQQTKTIMETMMESIES